MMGVMKCTRLLVVLAPVMLFACGGPKEGPAAPIAEAPPSSSQQTATPGANTPETAAPKESAAAEPNGAIEPETPPAASAAPSGSREETRTLSVIQEIVKQHRGTVRDCYKKALKEHPDVTGHDLTIAFTINPKGKVTEAKVNADRSDLRIPELDACAIDTILKLEFPPSSRGRETTVNYPFNFTPGNH
jgi:TonB family protein